MDDRTKVLQDILVLSAGNLRRDLEQFWPAFGNNEMAEANVVVHLAGAFLASGFGIYSEVALEPTVGPRASRSSARLDLLAMKDGWMIGIEAKRLYHGDQAQQIANDWSRFDTHQPTTEFGNPRATTFTRCVVATSWMGGIDDWWKSPTSEVAEHDGWRALRACLAQPNSVRVSNELLKTNVTGAKRQVLLAAFSHDARLPG